MIYHEWEAPKSSKIDDFLDVLLNGQNALRLYLGAGVFLTLVILIV